MLVVGVAIGSLKIIWGRCRTGKPIVNKDSVMSWENVLRGNKAFAWKSSFLADDKRCHRRKIVLEAVILNWCEVVTHGLTRKTRESLGDVVTQEVLMSGGKTQGLTITVLLAQIVS